MGGSRRPFRSADAACAVAFLATFHLVGPLTSAAARPQNPTISFERGRRDIPKVALTFDGGGDAGESGQILDVLGSGA